jgi:phospholipid-binding lipoprotein MlaA
MHRTGPARALTLALCALLAGCATTQRAPSPKDPWEPVNRATWEFNQVLDKGLVKPVAKAYRKYVPRFAQIGVNNFLTNLGYTTTIVNNLLQLKMVDAASDTARFVINSSLGLGGLFDPATDAGLKRNDEDFGQTLGWWGVPSGPFLMLPLFGPSTLRDGPSLVGDYYTDVRSHLDNTDRQIDFAYAGLTVVNARARILPAEAALQGAFDRYALVRNAYLERREFQVRDGDVPEAPADAGFSEDELDQIDDEMGAEDTAAEEAAAAGSAPDEEPPPGDEARAGSAPASDPPPDTPPPPSP